MSEKLYSLLLRLYPSRFRRQYGDEARRVFRDRLRDEQGILKRARLWLDLLFDLTVSAPREHRRATEAPIPAPTGFPSFQILEDEPLRPNMFVFGTLLGLIALGTFGFLLTHGGNRVLLPGASNEPLHSATTPALSADKTAESQSAGSAADATKLPVLITERQLVVQEVIEAVQHYDSHPAESQAVAELLRRHENSGDYAGIHDRLLFAQLLTRQIRGVTRYIRVTVVCDPQPPSSSRRWAPAPLPPGNTVRTIDDHFSVELAQAEKR